MSLLVATVVAMLGVGLAGQLATASAEPRTVTVQLGPDAFGDRRPRAARAADAEGVVELQVANGLSTAQINAGQQLVIPTP